MDAVPVSEMLRHLAVPFEVIKEKEIREVATILSAADLVIANDTGIMHVAAGVGVPVLSLFGPTDPSQWAPIGRQHRFLKGRDGDINTITANEVIRCAEEMLSLV
jgi:ADP-heptose:LPS heptosyltransferase